jgi:hypothetical protein
MTTIRIRKKKVIPLQRVWADLDLSLGQNFRS